MTRPIPSVAVQKARAASYLEENPLPEDVPSLVMRLFSIVLDCPIEPPTDFLVDYHILFMALTRHANSAADDVRAEFMELLDAHDDALCARKDGGVAAGECVAGLRKLLGAGGFERRRSRLT